MITVLFQLKAEGEGGDVHTFEKPWQVLDPTPDATYGKTMRIARLLTTTCRILFLPSSGQLQGPRATLTSAFLQCISRPG